jgi:hypothetical protein
MNLEARGLYIPRLLTPSRFTLHSPPRILSPQRHHESSAISDEPPPRVLRRRSFFRHKLASSSSSSFEILDIISATPLAAMDPESPHQAIASGAAESPARSSDTESGIPETSGGSWDHYTMDQIRGHIFCQKKSHNMAIELPAKVFSQLFHLPSITLLAKIFNGCFFVAGYLSALLTQFLPAVLCP